LSDSTWSSYSIDRDKCTRDRTIPPQESFERHSTLEFFVVLPQFSFVPQKNCPYASACDCVFIFGWGHKFCVRAKKRNPTELHTTVFEHTHSLVSQSRNNDLHHNQTFITQSHNSPSSSKLIYNTMSDQSTTTNAPNEPQLCKMGCGFFVSVNIMPAGKDHAIHL
jgi:hypothetical protein